MSLTPVGPADLLRELVIANRILANEGVLDAFGHVSVRHPDDPSRFIIARRVSPETVSEDDFQCFTFDGTEVRGDTRPAYAERAIHAGVYEARPDVQAICHNHAPSVIPFSVTPVPLRAIFHVAGHLGTGVPVWDIADEFGETSLLVQNLEQGRSLARTLGAHTVALMRGHGCTVASQYLRHAVFCAVYTERNAQLQLQAISLGEVRFLSEREAALAAHQHTLPMAVDRAWDCWAQRLVPPG
jgi:ribulose-5-phosphate 4-epimerase/fuculose-1-phosphate aldolase